MTAVTSYYGAGAVPATQGQSLAPKGSTWAPIGMDYEGDSSWEIPADKTRCQGVKKDGAQCGAHAVKDESYCIGHLRSHEAKHQE